MNIVVEDAGPCRKTLKIEIPADAVDEEFDSVLSSYAKAAKIPGFRPGKAPRNLVRNRFKKEIEDDVRQRLIPQGYQDAVKEKNIEAVAVLNVSDVSCVAGKPMTFNVTCDVSPDFKLPSYEGIKLKKQKQAIKDDDVQKTLDQILDQRAKFEDVTDRPAKKGDLVQVDYDGICDGKPLEEIAPNAAGLGSSKDFWLLVDDHAFLPEFADGLAGGSIGETKQIDVNFPKDFTQAELAGKKASYTVAIKGIREKILPPLDDELIKTFGVESEDELRKQIREDLESTGERNENERLRGEIVRHLIEKTKLDVPESVIQEETRKVMYDIVRENSMRGVTQETIEAQKGQLFEVASRTASEKVRSRYILHRIAQQEEIEISPEDVDQRIQMLSTSYGMTPDQLRTELEKREGMDNLEEDIRFGKTIDRILEKAKIS